MRFWIIFLFFVDAQQTNAQSLLLENYNGKSKAIPYGSEIIVHAQQNGGKDYVMAKGILVNSAAGSLDLKVLLLEKTIDCNNPNGFVSTICYTSYQDSRIYSIPHVTIDEIEIMRKSDLYNQISMQLTVIGAVMALIASPIYGAFDRSENRFLHSGPGRLAVIGSGLTFTGLILYANRPKNHKFAMYPNDQGIIVPGKTWRIQTL
jgi:hypothetical protein